MTGSTIGKLSWDAIENTYQRYCKKNYAAQCERAQLLQEIQEKEPWKDAKRYASKAAHAALSLFSWRQVVEERLHENFIEVTNTIEVLDAFGCEKMREMGRDALLLLLNRTDDPKLHESVFKEVRQHTSNTTTRTHVGYSTFGRIVNERVPKSASGKARGGKTVASMLAYVKKQNAKLKVENAKLRAENAQLRVDNRTLIKENTQLRNKARKAV